MSWADIWKIILAALASVGGIGGLIIFVIKMLIFFDVEEHMLYNFKS